jgi:hypothetical protein
VVRYGGALEQRRLGRADVESAVDGARVGAHNLGIEPPGERDRRPCLAGRGGTGDDDDVSALSLS